jgi:cysteine sulfinate desulfinase/cysteine desulfurase-like protein
MAVLLQFNVLYDNPALVSIYDVQKPRLRAAINLRTRIFSATWGRSSTGVKLPIREMVDTITKLTKQRKANQQILFCVDGVHGFGIENQDISQLGCNFPKQLAFLIAYPHHHRGLDWIRHFPCTLSNY